MKKPTALPCTINLAGVAFNISSSPLTWRLASGKQATYESWVVRYYLNGRRMQARRKSWPAVEELLQSVVAAVRNNDPDRLELVGKDRSGYLEALAALDGTTNLSTAVRDYMEARKRLGSHSLSDAVSFFLQNSGHVLVSKTVSEVITELVATIEAGQRSKYHVLATRQRLGYLERAFPEKHIHEITPEAFEHWLGELAKTVAPKTCNNVRGACGQLFRFAQRRKYISRAADNPVANTHKLTEDMVGDNHIIGAAELRTLLEAAPVHIIPFIVIKAFAGLRTEELWKLPWSALLLDSRQTIHVDKNVSKLRQKRIVPIQPVLNEWLQPFAGLNLTGRLFGYYRTAACVHQALSRTSRRVKVDLGRNTLRNCYISYRLAMPTAVDMVAQEAGNTKRMIDANYQQLTTKPVAEAWFSVRPTAKNLEDLKAYATKLSTLKTFIPVRRKPNAKA